MKKIKNPKQLDKKNWPWNGAPKIINHKMPSGLPWPKISIVTPSYNQSQFIEETILSVINQGYPNLEYIIIDGRSTDSSLEIIKKYENKLAYWTSEPDRGQSHAINKGWNISTGRIISWLNSDDYLEEGTLFRVANIYAKSDYKIGFLHGKTWIIDKNNNRVGIRGSEFDLVGCIKNSIHPISQPSVFFNSEVINNIGLLDENLHMSMDWDLFIRVAKNHPVIFVDEYLANFRQTPFTKTSTNKLGFGPDMLTVLNKIYNEQYISPSLISVKNRAYCTAYLRSSNGAFKSGDKINAWVYLLNAVRHDFFYFFQHFFRKYLKVMLGIHSILIKGKK